MFVKNKFDTHVKNKIKLKIISNLVTSIKYCIFYYNKILLIYTKILFVIKIFKIK